MRVERIEIRQTRMELVSAFETSMGVEAYEDHIIVRVDGEGLTGWGESPVAEAPHYSPETVGTAWHILRDFLIPATLGRTIERPADASALWAKLRGHRMAKAGLEAALWDALAKARGLSLSRMLGGLRDRVAVGVSVGLQASPEALVRKVAAYLEEGYGRIKIKIAPGRDLVLVKALRAAFGALPLQVDANSAFGLEDAPVFEAMDGDGLLLIEQPLSHEDIYDHAKLQKRLRTPICLDESIHSLADARAAVELGSCRVINIKPARVGGFLESAAIHDYCAGPGHSGLARRDARVGHRPGRQRGPGLARELHPAGRHLGQPALLQAGHRRARVRSGPGLDPGRAHGARPRSRGRPRPFGPGQPSGWRRSRPAEPVSAGRETGLQSPVRMNRIPPFEVAHEIPAP